MILNRDKTPRTLRIWDVIGPVFIFLLPLRHVAMGVDISDTGYNLGCFKWFATSSVQGMWTVVTYIANLVGHIMTKLPGGDTWLGMNIYTSMVVSLMGLIAYYFLRPYTGKAAAFWGVIIAQLLCWCPQIILYNYLTYFGLMAGSILLFKAITKDYAPPLFIASGLVLGFGVGTRFSNLTHMALILILWYDIIFISKKEIRELFKYTGLCILGYVAGLLIFLAMAFVQCGATEYLEMIRGLGTLSASGGGYSGAQMIISPFAEYADAMFPWGMAIAIYIAIWYFFAKRLPAKGKPALFIKVIVPSAGLLILIRYLMGRGMFGADYNEYFSIVRWTSLFIVFCFACFISALSDREASREEKLLYCMGLITILILPLGSNNKAYPVINDLFLTAPLAIYRGCCLIFKKERSVVIKAAAICLTFVFLIQAAGFGATFIFRDPSSAGKRDTVPVHSPVLSGMHTRADNARAIDELCVFWQENIKEDSSVILYGDIPGLSYILDAPSAITTTWSNLESYNIEYWERDFARVSDNIHNERPVVIIGREYTPIDDKSERLKAFLDRFGYREIFTNSRFSLYI